MRRFMEQTPDWPGPIYIRLAKGGDPVVSRPEDGFAIGRAIVLRDPGAVLIVAAGVTVFHALNAAEALAGEGIACGVVNLHTVKPLDAEIVLVVAWEARLVVTVEEHVRIGGLGSAVLEALSDGGVVRPLRRLGIPDCFTHVYGSQDGLLTRYGLDAEGIAAAVRDAVAEPAQARGRGRSEAAT
jgi:transketolase